MGCSVTLALMSRGPTRARWHAPVQACLMVTILLAGCSTPAPDAPAQTAEPPRSPGAGPGPVEPPFDMLPAEPFTFTASDGITLSGYLWRPKVSDGVRVPVLLEVTQYPLRRSGDGDTPAKEIVPRGFALAKVNARGMSASGGCFNDSGLREQEDVLGIIDHLSKQPWSNGRVGMIGVSSSAPAVMAAAIHAPPALKAVVVSGMVASSYTFSHTPQGAASSIAPDFAKMAMERYGNQQPCPFEESETIREGIAHDNRDWLYWEERNFLARMPQVRAAVLVAQGFQDTLRSGHSFEEDVVFQALSNAPVFQLIPQATHGWPSDSGARPEWNMPEWWNITGQWFSYWLADAGPLPDGLGTVRYQDSAGQWRNSTMWPPREAQEEALYLANKKLRPAPADASATFHLRAPEEGWLDTACGPTPRSLLYESPPMARDAVIAGNPYAVLQITSSAPGGIVSVDVFDVPASGACDSATFSSGAIHLTRGAADLRFLTDPYNGTDFPTGIPVSVRVDLMNIAHVLSEGRALAVVVGRGGPERTGQPFEATIDISGGSWITLPFVEGSFGGSLPPAAPPRPLLPAPAA